MTDSGEFRPLQFGIVFDPRILGPGTAVLGAGIYEANYGSVVAVVRCRPEADLADVIAQTLRALSSAGCTLHLSGLDTAAGVRQRLIARILPSSETLRREIRRVAVAGSALPETFLSVRPRSKLDVLRAATAVCPRSPTESVVAGGPAPAPDEAARQGVGRWETVRLVPQKHPVVGRLTSRSYSLAVDRHASAAKAHLRSLSDFEIVGGTGRQFQGIQKRTFWNVQRTVVFATGLHSENLEHSPVYAHRHQIQGKPGVFHPEASARRLFAWEEKQHSVVGAKRVPAGEAVGSSGRVVDHFHTERRMSPIHSGRRKLGRVRALRRSPRIGTVRPQRRQREQRRTASEGC